jgi:alkylation response protein AidB-like acyl-CoA dehydrogenase
MDMELTDTQQQLMLAARRFMQTECPSSLVRECETSDSGYATDLWHKMAGLGWLGLPFPADVGGFELGTVDLVVLAKELGRALCPSPFIPSVVLSGGAIAAAGSDEQKRKYLPQIAAGELVIAFALQEPSRYFDPRGIHARATAVDGGYALNGEKMFIEYAGAANKLLVIARTSGAAPSSNGITMFLVEAEAAGITLSQLNTMARDKQYHITLQDVFVSADDVVGPVDGAWPLLEDVVFRGVVTLCAYAVGASEQIHHLATEFAKQRVQFGRPIGSFQAIQHYLAQSITEIVGAETTTFYAAWQLDQGMLARAQVAKAKILAGDTFKNASSIGAQIHGGLGFNEDVDTTLFLRRGKQYQLSMGDSGYWEDVLAEELLDK